MWKIADYKKYGLTFTLGYLKEAADQNCREFMESPTDPKPNFFGRGRGAQSFSRFKTIPGS